MHPRLAQLFSCSRTYVLVEAASPMRFSHAFSYVLTNDDPPRSCPLRVIKLTVILCEDFHRVLLRISHVTRIV